MSKCYNNINSSSIILTRPIITEKATFLSGNSSGGVYTFEISSRTNKSLVAEAIRKIFKVTPVRVNILNTKPKVVIRKGKRGVVSGIKKAMVYLKKGEKIDLV